MPTGPKGQKRPADVIGNAVRVMRITTGEETEELDDSKMLAAAFRSSTKICLKAEPRMHLAHLAIIAVLAGLIGSTSSSGSEEKHPDSVELEGCSQLLREYRQGLRLSPKPNTPEFERMEACIELVISAKPEQ